MLGAGKTVLGAGTDYCLAEAVSDASGPVLTSAWANRLLAGDTLNSKKGNG